MKEICRPARDEWVLAADPMTLELKLFTHGALQSLCLVPDEERETAKHREITGRE